MYASQNDWWSYLAHHGIKGQKWGERNAVWYPIDEYLASMKNKKKQGKLTDSEKKDVKYAKKIQRDEVKKQKKEAKVEKQIRRENAQTDAAVRIGNLDYAKKHPDRLTNAQLELLLSKAQLNKRISQAKADAAKVDNEKVETRIKSLDNLIRTSKNAVDLYNVAAKVHNSLKKDETPWKVIDMSNNSDKDKKKDGVESIFDIYESTNDLNKKKDEKKLAYHEVVSYKDGVKYTTQYGARNNKDDDKDKK